MTTLHGKRPDQPATRSCQVGHVTLGGRAPVVVQSMTNTDTADYVATAIQCAELARAGSELVRITVNTPEAAAAVPKIREHLDRMGCSVPLIGDFHTTATGSSPNTRPAPRPWPSTGSIRAMWVSARRRTSSSPP